MLQLEIFAEFSALKREKNLLQSECALHWAVAGAMELEKEQYTTFAIHSGQIIENSLIQQDLNP